MDHRFAAYTAISCFFCGELILGCKEHACYNINNYKKENMANCQYLINWNKKETFHLGKFGLWRIIDHIKDNTIYKYFLEDSLERHNSHSKYFKDYDGDWDPELPDTKLRAKNLEKMILDFVGDDLNSITIEDDGNIDSIEKCFEFKCVGDIYEWEKK